MEISLKKCSGDFKTNFSWLPFSTTGGDLFHTMLKLVGIREVVGKEDEAGGRVREELELETCKGLPNYPN